MTQDDRLAAIFDKLDELTKAVATHSAICGQCGPRLHDLETTVRGNGRSGILGRLVRIEVVLTLLGAMFVLVVVPLSIGVGTIWATMRHP